MQAGKGQVGRDERPAERGERADDHVFRQRPVVLHGSEAQDGFRGDEKADAFGLAKEDEGEDQAAFQMPDDAARAGQAFGGDIAGGSWAAKGAIKKADGKTSGAGGQDQAGEKDHQRRQVRDGQGVAGPDPGAKDAAILARDEASGDQRPWPEVGQPGEAVRLAMCSA